MKASSIAGFSIVCFPIFVHSPESEPTPLNQRLQAESGGFADRDIGAEFRVGPVGRDEAGVASGSDFNSGSVDVFAGRIIIADDGKFSVSNDYDDFSGIHVSNPTLVPWQDSQLHSLAGSCGVKGADAIAADADWCHTQFSLTFQPRHIL